MPNKTKGQNANRKDRQAPASENAVNRPSNQPGAANIRPSGNSTQRGADLTQSGNTGRGVENDRSR